MEFFKTYFVLVIVLFFNNICLHSQQLGGDPDSSAGNFYFELAEKFYYNGEYDSSAFYYNKAAEKFKSAGLWKEYLRSRNYQGINLRYLSRYDESFSVLNEALTIGIEKLGNKEPLLADIYNSIGSYFYETGELDSSFASYKNSLNLCLSLYGENHKNTARAYHNVGLIYYWQMDSEKALQYFEKSLYIWLSLIGEKQSAVGNCYLNIANAYFLMEDFDKAIEFALKSLNVWRSVLGEEHQYVAMAYNNLADTYETIGKYKEAIENDEKGLSLRKKIFGNKHIETANSLSHIANIYSKMGELDKAKQYFNDAFDIYKNYSSSNPYVLEALLNFSELKLKEGKFDDALKICDTVLSYTIPEVLAENFQTNKLQLNSLRTELLNAVFLKGEIYYRKFSLKNLNPEPNHSSVKVDYLLNSFKWFSRFHDILEILRKGYRNETSKLFLGKRKSETIEKLVDVSVTLYELTGRDEYKSAAFVFSEKDKAEALYDAIRESNAKSFSGIDNELLKHEKSLKAKKAYLETKIFELEKEQPGLPELLLMKKELFTLVEKHDSLINLFEMYYPEYYKLKYDVTVPDLPKIQKNLLDDNSVLLEYFIGDSLAFVFVIDRNQLIISKLTNSEIREQVNDFRTSLQNLDYTTYINSATKLYSILIEPIKQHLSGKNKVYIIPDGNTHYLPFEALLTENIRFNSHLNFKDLPYLLNKYEIVYNYSVKLLLNRKEWSDTEKYSFVGFAPVFIDDNIEKNKIKEIIDTSVFISNRSINSKEKNYSALPESDFEITEILNLFKSSGLRGEIYKYKNASEFNLKSDKISSYNCLHLATHGFINETNPRLSGLIFSGGDSASTEDGILYSEEAFNLNLNARLVVLSACESGLGKIINGEGILGLTRGFLYSGVDNLIVSLWRVADKSTAVLMLNFYKNLLSGKNYSAALREAKLDLLNEGKYSYPLEWSPFILIGK